MENTVYIKIAFSVLMLLSSLCLIAAHAERLRELVLRLFNILYSPFFQISAFCRRVCSAMINWCKGQIHTESDRNDSRHAVYYLCGCVLYAGLTALFIYCDLGLLIQSIEALGFTSTLQLVEPAVVMAVSMIASPVAWGIIFFDAIGITHLAPGFARLSNIGKIILTGVSIIFFVISMMSLIAFYYQRAKIIADSVLSVDEAVASELVISSDNAERDSLETLMHQLEGEQNADNHEDTSTRKVIYAGIILSGLSIVVCTMFCFTACVPLIKWVALSLSMIFLAPVIAVWGVSSVFALIVDALSGFVRNLLDLLVDLGDSILNKLSFLKSGRKSGQLSRPAEQAASDSLNSADVEKKRPEDAALAANETDSPVEKFQTGNKMGFDPFG